MWCTSYCNHGRTLIYHNVRELVSITCERVENPLLFLKGLVGAELWTWISFSDIVQRTTPTELLCFWGTGVEEKKDGRILKLVSSDYEFWMYIMCTVKQKHKHAHTVKSHTLVLQDALQSVRLFTYTRDICLES